MAPRAPRSSCSICHKRRPVAAGVCTTCRRRFALPEGLATEPRPLRPCLRCGHGVFVVSHVRHRADAGHLAPLAATYERRLKTPILTGEEEIEYDDAPEPERPIGLFVAHICRSCGFTEWYALEPEAIPIGLAHGTTLVIVDKDGPYR